MSIVTYLLFLFTLIFNIIFTDPPLNSWRGLGIKDRTPSLLLKNKKERRKGYFTTNELTFFVVDVFQGSNF